MLIAYVCKTIRETRHFKEKVTFIDVFTQPPVSIINSNKFIKSIGGAKCEFLVNTARDLR